MGLSLVTANSTSLALFILLVLVGDQRKLDLPPPGSRDHDLSPNISSYLFFQPFVPIMFDSLPSTRAL